MAMGIALQVRIDRLQVLAGALDAGSTPATLEIYTAARPATGAAITDQTLLGTLTFSQPCGTVNASAVLELGTITGETAALASADAVWARAKDGNGNFVTDLSVGTEGSGADIIINTVSIVEGGPIDAVGAQTITEGGA